MSDHRFRVEKGLYTLGASQFENGLTVNSGMTVKDGLLLVNGSFTVTGNYIVQGTTIQDVNIYPQSDGLLNIGSPTNTYNFAANNIYVKSTTGQIVPASNTLLLGNSVGRWVVYANTIDTTGAISTQGNFTVNTAGPAFTVDATNLRTAVNTVSTSGYALAVSGNVTITQGVIANGINLGVVGASNSFIANTSFTAVGNSSVNTQITPAAIVIGKTAFFQNTATVATVSPVVIDAFPVSLSKAAKLLIAVDGGAPMQLIEILLVTDGATNVALSKYGELYNGSRIGAFDADINAGNVRVLFTAANSSTFTVKTSRQQILV